MKKLLLFVLLTSFSFGYGQNLSLSQLMSLRTMPLDDTETYLTQRGWSYKDGEEETEENLGYINFIYGSNGSFEYAESFLTKIFSSYRGDRITIQVGTRTKYLEYLNAVKSFNPRLIFSGPEDGNLVKTYQGATTTFKFITATTNTYTGNDKTNWLLIIYSNEDFY